VPGRAIRLSTITAYHEPGLPCRVGPSGSAIDSEDTLRFSVQSGVRPMIEKYPLEKVADAYQQMISGKARFQVVLTMGK